MTAFSPAQLNDLPDEIKAQLPPSTLTLLGLSAPTPAAPARREAAPAEWVNLIGAALQMVLQTGAPFTAHTIVVYARAASPDVEIPGRESRDLVRAVLLADEQVTDTFIALARDFVLANLPANFQEAIKRGNIAVSPTTVKGHSTLLFTFLAPLPAKN